MKKYTFYVTGTHCPSCKILIEDILSEGDFIKSSNVNLKKETVTIETESNENPEVIAKILTEKVKPNGYTISVEKIMKENKSDGVIWKAVPIGLVFLILFFILQKSGILNLGIGGRQHLLRVLLSVLLHLSRVVLLLLVV